MKLQVGVFCFLALSVPMVSMHAMQSFVADSDVCADEGKFVAFAVPQEKLLVYRQAWEKIESLCAQDKFCEVRDFLKNLSVQYPVWGKKVFYRPCDKKLHDGLLYFMQHVGPKRIGEFGLSSEESAECANVFKEDRQLFVGPYAKELRDGTAVLMRICNDGKLFTIPVENKDKKPFKVQKELGETRDWSNAQEVTVEDLRDPGFVEFNVRDVLTCTALIKALGQE